MRRPPTFVCRTVGACAYSDSVSAQPQIDPPGPDDPAEILRVLPPKYHAQFRAEYAEAVEKAQRPEEFAALTALLRFWRLRALAYSDPTFTARLAAARERDFAGSIPLEQLIAERRKA